MYFAPNIYLAAVDERGVVLDLDRDRYFGLSPALTRAALLLTGRTEKAPHETGPLQEAQAKLVAQGILSEGGVAGPTVEIAPAAASCWPSLGRPPLSMQLSALRALSEVAWSLRRRPFRRTVAWLQQEKQRATLDPARSPQDLIDAFGAARPWFPTKPICRLDAAALCLHLWRNRCDADLIFGVRLDRFGAHCWTQHGETVVNDAHESVLQYTTIMSI